MSGFRYIGSKARVASRILDEIGDPDGGRFVDAMCGFGSVAREAAARGWPVLINDALVSAVVFTWGRLARHEDVAFQSLGGYSDALERLNRAKSRQGFVWATYSPGSAINGEPFERRYFTAANAAKIDGIRTEIDRWVASGHLSTLEERLLIADLLVAANRVANTAGTYGCFLRHWAPNAKRQLTLTPRTLTRGGPSIEAVVGDVSTLSVEATDTPYFDPPYTKRQYAAYYHVLESITLADEPLVEGITGLRPWKDKASDFAYRSRALEAIRNLMTANKARRSFLSYSSNGHVAIDALQSELASIGAVRIVSLGSIRAYAPSSVPSVSNVSEFLIRFERSAVAAVA